MVDQGATLGWTAAPDLMDRTAVVLSVTAPSDQRMRDCSSVSSVQCANLDFHANLTSVSAIQSITANLTTTLRFTAIAELHGTVVLCFAVTESGITNYLVLHLTNSKVLLKCCCNA